ncbi:MAG: hypothetical protein RLZZ205_366, partial [Bacteroidota bacterium]
ELSKQVPFERVLFALGIRHVGETVAKKLARSLKSVEHLMSADKDALLLVEEVGEKIADSILSYFSNPIHREWMIQLRNAGIQLESNQSESFQSNVLEGRIFVVSGVFEKYGRDELKGIIESHGGKVSGSISSKTHFVVAGRDMGPAKLEKAKGLGIPIISEVEFDEMISAE